MLSLSVASAQLAGAPQHAARDSLLTAHEGRVEVRSGEQMRIDDRDMAGTLVGVASGVGQDADVASALAVRTVARLATQEIPRRPDRVLSRYLLAAHAALHDGARRKGQFLAASLCAGWAVGGRLGWVQIGDTCVVRLQGGRVARISTEHTATEFAHRQGRALRSGPLDVVQHFIAGSTGLGDDAALHLQPGLDIGLESLEAGDRYLFTTQAVASTLDDDALAETLAVGRSADAMVHAVVQWAGRVRPDKTHAAVGLIVQPHSG